MKNVLFVCGNPPHPIHKKFAKSINADFFYYPEGKLSGIKQIPKNYDIYFTEGLFNYVVLAKLLGYLKKSSKIINLFSDPRLYQIVEGKKFDFKKLKEKKYPLIKREIAKKFIKKLDGAICVGKFEDKLLKKISKKIPSKIVYPFIRKSFNEINSPLKENNVLFIGNGSDYYVKGLDFLIEIFLRLNKENSKLFIIGDKWDYFKERYSNYGNIRFLGALKYKEIIKYMKKSSLYCQFSRGESFSAATLESMAAGIPCFVSNLIGVKEVVEKVSPKYVFSLTNKKRIICEILDYFNKPLGKKKILGRRFKINAKRFNEKEQIKTFKKKFDELLKELR